MSVETAGDYDGIPSESRRAAQQTNSRHKQTQRDAGYHADGRGRSGEFKGMTWQSGQDHELQEAMEEAGGHETPQWPALQQVLTGTETVDRADRSSAPGWRKRQETAIDRIVKLIFMSRQRVGAAGADNNINEWRAGQAQLGGRSLWSIIGTPHKQLSDPPHVILQCRPDQIVLINCITAAGWQGWTACIDATGAASLYARSVQQSSSDKLAWRSPQLATLPAISDRIPPILDILTDMRLS